MGKAALHLSVLTIVADGMDQAKFRIPRWRRAKVKALEKFPRPALHVAGVWAHGHSLHLAISNPDVPKDSNSNIETIARMIDTVLAQHGTLPLNLHLQLDNSARENKNQKLFRLLMILVQKGVFRTIQAAFLRKGHTHEDIDGIFGQIAVTISHSEFNTTDELEDILMRRLKTVGADTSSKQQSMAYRLDEVADWEQWAGSVNVKFEKHGGR